MKKLLAALAVIILVLFFLRTPDTDPDAMIAKYTNAASQFAENDEGLRVHYRDEGDLDGLPVILIHGTSASLHTWQPLVNRLGDNYRVITYTQPGHGLTGPHPEDDYSYAGMREALDLVIEETGVDRFVLGGNSMGGWVSWRYALEEPDRVAALILFNSSGMPLREGEEEPPLNIGFKLLGNPVGRFLMQQFTPRALVKRSALESVSVKDAMTEEVIDRYWELLRYPGNRRAAALRASVDREPQYADRVGDITAPTLLLWGAEDQLVFATAAKTFAERMPKTKTVILDGVGHVPMEEAPARTAAAVENFLRNVKIRDENR